MTTVRETGNWSIFCC